MRIPKFKEFFNAIESSNNQYHEHNGKRFKVLEDITDPALKDPGYGYVRLYRIELEDGIVIEAFEVEVEDFGEEFENGKG